ncbi:hypothetical protein [Schleiferilactobacillus perolens]|nr:hypothetical protein [Schleiferilactobacillus perolens]
MANWLQRALYMTSNSVPLLFVAALTLWLKTDEWKLSVLLICIAIILTYLFKHSFRYGIRHLPSREITVSGVASRDPWIVGYVFTYLLPLVNLRVSGFSVVTLTIISFILLIVATSAVVAYPNFILYVMGYHFYKLATESSGISDLLLISKKKHLRDKSNVTQVIRMFEKTLIDTQGG